MPITTATTPTDHELTQAACVGHSHNQHQPTPSPPQNSSTPPAPPPSQPHASHGHKVKVDLRVLQQRAFLNRGCFFILNARFKSNDEEWTYMTKAMLDGGAAINVMTQPIASILGLKPNPSLPEVVVQMGNAQPYVGTVADLKSQEPPLADISTKEFLHQQVCKLINNGFLIKVLGDQVWLISETHIVPKPATEIKSNVSIGELQCQVNASLKAMGLEHNPSMSDPAPLPIKLSEAQMTKAQYQLVHNYTPINHYMCDTAFVPGDIAIKVSKLFNKKFLFKGDGCTGFFIIANSLLATLLSITYIEDLEFCGYTVMLFGFKVSPSLYYQFITMAFGDLFDQDSNFWMDNVAAGHQDFGAYFTWLRAFLD
ncbi:uncharacterized protein UBRO2_05643 [Ustilago bromivora]|uniref:Uncharacterized protein n=1 Tax=Ustilago bromivora TaxID=307758 RepID=A0A8H8QS16_9BASI|nr:uncharacterized protein UBRO2_05643 [Ustilago bromivora]